MKTARQNTHIREKKNKTLQQTRISLKDGNEAVCRPNDGHSSGHPIRLIHLGGGGDSVNSRPRDVINNETPREPYRDRDPARLESHSLDGLFKAGASQPSRAASGKGRNTHTRLQLIITVLRSLTAC